VVVNHHLHEDSTGSNCNNLLPVEFSNGCVVCVVVSKDGLHIKQVFEEKDTKKVRQSANFVSLRLVLFGKRFDE